MKANSFLGFAFIFIIFCLLVPNIISSFGSQDQYTLDTSFVPNINPSEWQQKRQIFVSNVQKLLKKPAPPCSSQQLDTCLKQKKDLEEKIQNGNTQCDKIVGERDEYKSKWETTCQKWKNEKDILQGQKQKLQGTVMADAIQIDQDAKIIKDLEQKLKGCHTGCPECHCPGCIIPPCECQEDKKKYDLLKQNYDDLDLRYNQLKKNFDDCLKEKNAGSGTTEQCKSVHQVIVNKIKGDIGNLKGLIQGGGFGNTTKTNLKRLVAVAEQEASKSTKANETISAIGPLVNGLAQELKRVSSVGRRKGDLLEQCVRNYTISSEKLNLCEKKIAVYLPDKK